MTEDKAEQQRKQNLSQLRRQQRERDLYCGEGVISGRYFNSHGFNSPAEDLGAVARIDCERVARADLEPRK